MYKGSGSSAICYPSVSRRRVGLTRSQEFSLRAGQLAPLGGLHQLKLLL